MAEIGGFAEAFAGVVAEVAPVLDERVRRLLLGAGARVLGRGGIKLIAADTGAAADRWVDPETRGDPMSRLRWTTKSRVKLAEELTAQGHRVGPHVVARLLK